jgi:ABC-type Na+ efflux pump permease subunit
MNVVDPTPVGRSSAPNRLVAIIRREFVEGMRQRWLVVTLATVLGVIAFGTLALLWVTDDVLANPSKQQDIVFWTDVLGMKVADPANSLAKTVVVMLQALVVNQLMSMTAVMAGHAGLHDRQCGTLPFLLLAPVRRFELLLGKVVGALTVPLLLYVAVGGLASVAAATFLSASGSAAYLPPSGGWFAAFLLGAPAWSIVTGTVCVLVSAVARDVRTAQQASWAVMFFATFALSPLLVGLMPMGAVVQGIVAAIGLALGLALLALGSWVIGRDLSR